MGYYDDHSPNRSSGQKGKGGIFIASLVGAILGAILVIIAIPALSNNGLLPYTVQPNQKTAETTTDNTGQQTIHKQVAYDVKTNTTNAIDKTAAAVVGINNIQSTSFWSDSDNGDNSDETAGTGSGVIYKQAGGKAYVVTNHHVVEGATRLEVSLSDGTKLPAKLLGSDIWSDLAVLQIDANKVKKIAEFGDSDSLKIGEPVIAIGNPLGPTFSGSVTQGIISGLNRTIPVDIDQDGVVDWQSEVLQTDAAINPGNSGGALINMAGQVVGINSMKIAQNAVEGIGLSIPINSAKPIIDDLEKYGSVKRPYMGLDLKSVDEIPAYYQQEALKLPRDITYGVAIRQVVPGSPAARAGLQELDVIVEMDGQKINDVIDLRQHLYTKKNIGEKMTIKYYRNGKLRETSLTLTSDKIQ
ncbi:trypsin-like peptidase domain-containing protein [Neobacillus sp. YIM B02564]|uniref:Trypsin-like peptidase domain-containing protein n=1 Tax=Neobacillus paridis TaxID=2803862 RepID=A0ABS1TQ13_9BACI|nr:trypsin-like peptidase domain-containing protein [Neobacillus paridis]MBL4953352.1 trypsin-like peptidase domain-containing protein [Neobacillus paridis]